MFVYFGTLGKSDRMAWCQDDVTAEHRAPCLRHDAPVLDITINRRTADVEAISSNMAEDDADQSVLIVGYEKPWLDRSAISINNSFLDDTDESVSKVNHSSDHENLADEGEHELKQLKESQVKSQISACLASSTEKSQSSPDQHENNQSSTTFSRESSRENQESILSGRSSRGPEGKRASKDVKSRSYGERKSQLTNENPQESSKKQEGSRQRSSLKKRKRACSDMERSRVSRQKLKSRSEDNTEKK